MSSFMTEHPLPGDLRRVNGVQFQLACSQTHFWLCVLVLSSLSTWTCAASVSDIENVMICLKKLWHAIERSDTMLYAPSADDIKENCKRMSLRCYMLELVMAIDEEEIDDIYAQCISGYSDNLPQTNYVGCPPCEAYSLENSTVFLQRLNSLLQELNIP